MSNYVLDENDLARVSHCIGAQDTRSKEIFCIEMKQNISVSSSCFPSHFKVNS